MRHLDPYKLGVGHIKLTSHTQKHTLHMQTQTERSGNAMQKVQPYIMYIRCIFALLWPLQTLVLKVIKSSAIWYVFNLLFKHDSSWAKRKKNDLTVYANGLYSAPCGNTEKSISHI